jgi:hypothetical protein
MSTANCGLDQTRRSCASLHQTAECTSLTAPGKRRFVEFFREGRAPSRPIFCPLPTRMGEKKSDGAEAVPPGKRTPPIVGWHQIQRFIPCFSPPDCRIDLNNRPPIKGASSNPSREGRASSRPILCPPCTGLCWLFAQACRLFRKRVVKRKFFTQ